MFYVYLNFRKKKKKNSPSFHSETQNFIEMTELIPSIGWQALKAFPFFFRFYIASFFLYYWTIMKIWLYTHRGWNRKWINNIRIQQNKNFFNKLTTTYDGEKEGKTTPSITIIKISLKWDSLFHPQQFCEWLL